MKSSHLFALKRFADALAEGAMLELHLTPKPGLVDEDDCGSHPDLTFSLMERSLGIVSDCLRGMVDSLGREEPFESQVALGRRKEGEIWEELGTNTHKGYLFLSGLLLIARGRAASAEEFLVRAEVRSLARRFFSAQGRLPTNGERARNRYNVGGIVVESLGGYPSLFEGALPAFRSVRDRRGSERTAAFAMLARLMQTVEDTTALHRCGPEGLRRIHADGAELQRRLARGEEVDPFLARLNREYIARNLTMGGVADLLGLSFGWLIAAGDLPHGMMAWPAPAAAAQERFLPSMPALNPTCGAPQEGVRA